MSRQNKIREINVAAISATWDSHEQKGRQIPRVGLKLPHGCYFIGSEFYKGTRIVEAGTLRVKNPDLRGNGIGERLTNGLGAIAIGHGYRKLSASIISQYSLDIFGKVFGVEQISFGEAYGDGWKAASVQDFDVKRQRLVELEDIERMLEARFNGVEITVDLSHSHLAETETIEETAKPAFDWTLIK